MAIADVEGNTLKWVIMHNEDKHSMDSGIDHDSATTVCQWNEEDNISSMSKGTTVYETEKTTTDTIRQKTKDTVEMAAVSKVLDKMIDSPCVVIKGSSGEGKTTLGYWVLHELQKNKRSVYAVQTPIEFDDIIRTLYSTEIYKTGKKPSKPVVLLDDLFGQTTFNTAIWQKWRKSIEQFMKMNEKQTKCNLILIGRNCIFNVDDRDADDLWQQLVVKKHVVDISGEEIGDCQEKQNIVEMILTKFDIPLEDTTKTEICATETSHGFPHTCVLFATLYKKHEDGRISHTQFFEKPLEFLRDTLHVLIAEDEKIKTLFMEMIKGDGRLSNDECIRTAKRLCGTYLKLDGEGNYVFDHPSIMDMVAYLFCETHLSDILEHCSMEFIRERICLQTPDGKNRYKTKAGVKLMWEIPLSEAEELVRRFVREIGAGNLKDVTYHNTWTSEKLLELLIKNMTVAELNVPDRRMTGDTLLHQLSLENRVDYVKICLQRGSDVNKENTERQTALHLAAEHGHTETVLVLCEFRVDINIRDKLGQTALHKAAEHGHTETVRVLSDDSKVDVNITDCRGYTALHLATRQGHTETVREFCKISRVDVNIKDRIGQTALYRAVQLGHDNIVRLLCDASSLDVNIKDNGEDTALHLATLNKHIDIVRMLCEFRTVDVNIKDSLDQTALHKAAKSENADIVRVLCKSSGVDVNIKDSLGQTALHKAALFGYIDIVNVLCKTGVDVNIKNNQDQTAMDFAKRRGHKNIISLLLEVGCATKSPSTFSLDKLT